MTVKELIEHLSKMPQDAKVFVNPYDGAYCVPAAGVHHTVIGVVVDEDEESGWLPPKEGS